MQNEGCNIHNKKDVKNTFLNISLATAGVF